MSSTCLKGFNKRPVTTISAAASRSKVTTAKPHFYAISHNIKDQTKLQSQP